MGAFPVYPRILATFMKGRWNFTRAFPTVPELPPWLMNNEPASPGVYSVDGNRDLPNRARNAFRFLVDAAEDGEAYEGGLELINPPLGFIYYHLWLTVHTIHKMESKKLKLIKKPQQIIMEFLDDLKKRERLRQLMKELQESDEFRGERERFFGEEFLRTKAKTHLREMWARHGNDEGFFAYAEKHQYLADSFSDSYVNGLWAVEYGLLPVASNMLKCLCCPEQTASSNRKEKEKELALGSGSAEESLASTPPTPPAPPTTGDGPTARGRQDAGAPRGAGTTPKIEKTINLTQEHYYKLQFFEFWEKSGGGVMRDYDRKYGWKPGTLSGWKRYLKGKGAWPRRPGVRIVVKKSA